MSGVLKKLLKERNKWNHGNEKLWHGDGIQYKFLHNFALPHNYPLFDSNWVFFIYIFLHCYLFVCVMLWRRMAVLWNNVINSILLFYTPTSQKKNRNNNNGTTKYTKHSNLRKITQQKVQLPEPTMEKH